jgi:hypothetical protein
MMDKPAPADDDARLAHEMHAQLKALLDRVPTSRRVFMHLGTLERTLAEDGLPGIDWLPQTVLEKAHEQLAALPLPASSQALPQLVSLLELAVRTRKARQAATGSAPFLSSFLTDEKLIVSEASATDFQRALDEPPKY